jgi:CRP/FNR family transcriptional regulator, cyclic AMP receptor protein
MNFLSMFRVTTDTETFRAGETIFREGSRGKAMYAILDGDVELRIGDNLIETVTVGNVIGEMALIDSRPRSATANAITDCRLAPINEKQFLLLVQETPFFSLYVMRVLAERLRKLDTEFATSNHESVDDS